MKKSSPSSVSLAKLSNIWKRWEIFPINTLLAAQCHHLPPPRNPPALERNPVCVCNLYPARRPNPSSSLFQLIPPSALLLLQTQESITYRIEGGEAVLVCEHIGEFPAAPVPISHKPVTAGAGHICKGTPGCDWPHQSCPHQPPFDFWIPSSCSLWTQAWGEGVCLPALMAPGQFPACCPDTALVPNRAVPRKSAGTTHPSPGSRTHPRSRSGCFGNHSPQCPHGWTHSWGWGRLWGIQLCHCPANPPSTDGIPSRRGKSIIRLKMALSWLFCPSEHSHCASSNIHPTPKVLGTVTSPIPV